MTTYFVSRHAGARVWAGQQGLVVDVTLAHLDLALLQGGDTVIGNLPIHLAAEACARGARYLHLALDARPEDRGDELTADRMRAAGARLDEYRVTRVE